VQRALERGQRFAGAIQARQRHAQQVPGFGIIDGVAHPLARQSGQIVPARFAAQHGGAQKARLGVGRRLPIGQRFGGAWSC
jgi:hypothetical protein